MQIRTTSSFGATVEGVIHAGSFLFLLWCEAWGRSLSFITFALVAFALITLFTFTFGSCSINFRNPFVRFFRLLKASEACQALGVSAGNPYHPLGFYPLSPVCLVCLVLRLLLFPSAKDSCQLTEYFFPTDGSL